LKFSWAGGKAWAGAIPGRRLVKARRNRSSKRVRKVTCGSPDYVVRVDAWTIGSRKIALLAVKPVYVLEALRQFVQA
jgi:hypothetical protein